MVPLAAFQNDRFSPLSNLGLCLMVDNQTAKQFVNLRFKKALGVGVNDF